MVGNSYHMCFKVNAHLNLPFTYIADYSIIMGLASNDCRPIHYGDATCHFYSVQLRLIILIFILLAIKTNENWHKHNFLITN